MVFGKRYTRSFDHYTQFANQAVDQTVPHYISVFEKISPEFLSKMIGGLTKHEIMANWKSEFSADVVGALICCMSVKNREKNEAKQYALDSVAYVGAELVFALTQLLEDYYIHFNKYPPYFNSHPFGKDRFDFIRGLADIGLFPKGFACLGDIFREKGKELTKMLESEDRKQSMPTVRRRLALLRHILEAVLLVVHWRAS